MCIREELDMLKRRTPILVKALTAPSLVNNFPIFTVNPSLVNESIEPIFFLRYSVTVVLPFFEVRNILTFQLSWIKNAENIGFLCIDLVSFRGPVNCKHYLFFGNTRNVDDTAATHRALSRVSFSVVCPLISTLHTFPCCQEYSLPLTSITTLKHLIFSVKELDNSAFSGCFFGRPHHNLLWHKRNLFATFRTFTIVLLNYLIWGLQIHALVENKTAFLTNHFLRQRFHSPL